MIGVMPRYRPRALKRPTLAYTRRRRRAQPRAKHPAPRTSPVTTEMVLFHHGPAEFPIATARPREPRGRVIALVGAFQHWLAARWQWLKPRTVPVAVAALGMAAVIEFSDYLAHFQDGAAPHARTVRVDPAGRSESAPLYLGLAKR